MNRSILIVICDFLLVSLLVFSTPDTDEDHWRDGREPRCRSEQATNAPSGGKDLAMVMRSALTEEQQKREQLHPNWTKRASTAAQQQKQLSRKRKARPGHPTGTSQSCSSSSPRRKRISRP